MRDHVAVDMDDVVLDFVGGLLTAIKNEFDVIVPPEAIVDFNLRPILDPIVGRNWWAWLRDRNRLWSNFPAVNGAMGALDQLRQEGYYLELLTSKPEWAEYAVWQWLAKWRPPFQRVTIVSPKQSKVDYSAAALLVDDKKENVMDFAMAGRRAILFGRSHNQSEDLRILGVPRIVGWPSTVREIRSMMKDE